MLTNSLRRATQAWQPHKVSHQRRQNDPPTLVSAVLAMLTGTPRCLGRRGRVFESHGSDR